ncbi:MAG: ABC transporter permease, partial [Caldilineaceae bacterium]
MTADAQPIPTLRPIVRRKRLPSILGPLAVLAVLIVALTLINPRFVSGANLQNLARQSSILVMLALGQMWIILLGSIDLSIEGSMALSSVVVGILAQNLINDNDFGLLAVVAGVGAGVLMGFANGMLHTRLRIPAFMTTLGMAYIGMGIATWLATGMNIPLKDDMILSWARGIVG